MLEDFDDDEGGKREGGVERADEEGESGEIGERVGGGGGAGRPGGAGDCLLSYPPITAAADGIKYAAGQAPLLLDDSDASAMEDVIGRAQN